MAQSANEILGTNVRRLRLERGWTQEDLGHAADLLAPAVGRVERAATDTRVSTAGRIAAALNVPIGALFEERG